MGQAQSNNDVERSGVTLKVFLAGATGAIGRSLVPQLVEAGHEVTAITRSEEKLGMLGRLGAEPVLCDVIDAGRLGSVVARAEPNAIVNELTDLPQRLNPRKLGEYYAANNRVRREGTINLLDAARGAGVRRFLVQGSAYWYAQTGGPVKTEEAPLYLDAPPPIGPAVETIKDVEDAVLSAAGIEGVVLRYGFFYGPGTWYAKDGDVGRQIRKRRYPMIGHGEGTYSFIHIDDAASATVAALESARPGVYNVADDEPTTAAEWMPVFAEALGAKRPTRVPAFVARLIVGDAIVKWSLGLRGASNAKIKTELGWRPRYASWRQGFFEAAVSKLHPAQS
jgi:nucleoside-diphosphate-sugar epimerase